MKKLFFFLISAVLVLSMLTGCDMGGNNDDMASDINSTVSGIVSDTESMLTPSENVSSDRN